MLQTFRAIHLHVLQIHIEWAQFRYLFTVSDERMTMLHNTAPGFFWVVREVLRNNTFMGIRRLTDPPTSRGKRNLSLRTLVAMAEALPDEQLFSTTRALMEGLLDRTRTIRLVGDQWLAHTDLARALSDEPLADLKVQRGEVDLALGCIRELIWLFADNLAEPRANYDMPIIVGDADLLARVLEDATKPAS
jgi:hypothetical protein